MNNFLFSFLLVIGFYLKCGDAFNASGMGLLNIVGTVILISLMTSAIEAVWEFISKGVKAFNDPWNSRDRS